MKMGKYIENNSAKMETGIGSQESEKIGIGTSPKREEVNSPEPIKSEVEMMTLENLEKELKSVVMILKNSDLNHEMISYKKELEFEIEKRKIKETGIQESGISKYFSELLQKKFIVNNERGIVRFEAGEKYSFDEIDRMIRNNYKPKDVKLLHSLKSKFAVKYVETESRFQEVV